MIYDRSRKPIYNMVAASTQSPQNINVTLDCSLNDVATHKKC